MKPGCRNITDAAGVTPPATFSSVNRTVDGPAKARHDGPMPARKQRPAPPADAPTPDVERGGILTIDLAAIVGNWRELGRRAAPAQCAAVVKADGYGCGIAPVAAALASAGCGTFFVADLAEARSVRRVVPAAALYVLNGLAPGTAAALAEADLRPVLGSLSELAEWEEFRAGTGWRGGAALHVDTGMKRLGLAPEQAAEGAGRTV